MGRQSIIINDDVANKIPNTTYPGEVILWVGTSVKQPVGQDFIKGNTSNIIDAFGKIPVDPFTLVNGTLSDKEKKRKLDTLSRNLTYNAIAFRSMFAKGSEPVIIAVRVGEYGFASLELKENQVVNAVADPYNKPTRPGAPLNSITFKALEGGDEYNYFKIKVDVNAAGIATKFSMKYETPPTSTYGSLMAITDNSITNTVFELVDVDGLGIDEIAAKLNAPDNPFSKYVQAVVNYVDIEKKNISYVKGNLSVTIPNTDEGAFRLKSVESFKLKADPMEATFTEGAENFAMPMQVFKDPEAKIPTITQPVLTVTATYPTTGDLKSKEFKDTNLVPAPADLPNLVQVYNFKFVPDYSMFWDKDLTTMSVKGIYFDNSADIIPPAGTWSAKRVGTDFVVNLSEAIVTGIDKPMINEYTDETKVTKKDYSVFFTKRAATGGETAITEDYSSFAVAYVDADGQHSISDKFELADVQGNVVDVAFTLDADGKFKISERLRKILIIAYQKIGTGGTEVPVVLAHATMNFSAVAGGDIPQWIPDKTTIIIDETSASPEVLGMKNNTAMAKESITLIYEFTPKLIEQQDMERLAAWNTYYVTGNRVLFGQYIPENFELRGTVNYEHILREGSDYIVVSNGNNPGDPTDTIQFMLKPENSEQFASINTGKFTINYEVVPALPGRMDAFTALKGGAEAGYLSDEQYMKLALEKLEYYAPKFKPTRIYVCGLSTDFAYEGNNPTNGKLETIPLNSITAFGTLVDTFVRSFPTSLHMNSKRNYITNVNDANNKAFADQYLFEHREPVADLFSATNLRQAYNTPNLRVAAGLLHITNTAQVNGRNVYYKMPIYPALISLRNAILMDFTYETYAVPFAPLPTNIESLIEGDEYTKQIHFLGFEMYSKVYTEGGTVPMVKAITAPTAVLQVEGVAQGRESQSTDDGIKKILMIVTRFNDRKLIGLMGVKDTVVESNMRLVEQEVKDTFANSNFLSSVKCNLFFSEDYKYIKGEADLTIEAEFNPSIREIATTITIKIKKSL